MMGSLCMGCGKEAYDESNIPVMKVHVSFREIGISISHEIHMRQSCFSSWVKRVIDGDLHNIYWNIQKKQGDES